MPETLVAYSRSAIDAVIWIVVVPGPFLLVPGLILWGLRRRPAKPAPPETQPGD